MAATDRINEAATYVEYEDVVKTNGEPGRRKVEFGYLPVRFKAVSSDDRATTVTHSSYRKALQKYYWRIIFDKLNMQKYATSKLNEQINKFIETNKNAPFTMANIYRVIDIVIQTTGQRMLSALEEAFDTICELSAENSTAGEKWKTNANYMVNKRFIVDWMTDYGDYSWHRDTVHIRYGGNRDKIDDVTKALCYLTGRSYDSVGGLQVAAEGQPWGTWFVWGFFKCIAYKKGTMHFEFLDENVWYKFNETVARQRGWSLPKKSSPKTKAKKTSSRETSLF